MHRLPLVFAKPKTITRYLEKAAELRNATIVRRAGNSENLDWLDVVDDLISRKSDIAYSSFRYYRASLYAAIDAALVAAPVCERLKIAREKLANETSANCASSTSRTSSRKLKNFPASARAAIFAAMGAPRSEIEEKLFHFLRATCGTGHRPGEWRKTTVKPPALGYDFEIVVENAKVNMVRAHGPVRTLRWRHISTPLKESIIFTIDFASSCVSDEEYEKIRDLMQERLRDLCDKVWNKPRRAYALYSCRHQFIIDARRIMSPEVIATLIGHATDETHTIHYGKGKRRSKKPSKDIEPECDSECEKLEADPAEVANVRKLLTVRSKRLENHSNYGEVASLLNFDLRRQQVPEEAEKVEIEISEMPMPPIKNNVHARKKDEDEKLKPVNNYPLRDTHSKKRVEDIKYSNEDENDASDDFWSFSR